MHHIYTTKAIIVKSLPSGEANKIYFLLTKDLGFIKASAQGVRLSKSKLKGHLEDLSIVSISVVKGKEVWRITSTEAVYQNGFVKQSGKLSILKNIFSLLLRLLHGEEKNEGLFDCVNSFYIFLANTDLSPEQLKNLEMVVVLRILYYLGYLKESSVTSPFIADNALSIDTLAVAQKERKQAIFEINEALQHTNL